MAKLADLATGFATDERPAGNLLDGDAVLAQAIAATRFYAGYASITSREGAGAAAGIGGDTEVSESEWAVIRPLFLLYVERETALQLESSRMMGIDPYGRSSSEIGSDIGQYEAGLPRLAFYAGIITV